MPNKKVPTYEEESYPGGFVMYYNHCGKRWIDTWECVVDNECPVCRKDVQPYAIEDL